MLEPDYRLWFPRWCPVRKNVYYECHWGTRKRLRKDAAKTLYYARKNAGIPRAEGKRRIRITIVFGKGQRAGDPDGYVSPLLDAMQDALLLKDDSYKWVETLPVRIARDWERPGTMLEIWEL